MLTVIEESAAAAALHDAWVTGQIPDFPDSDHELVLAQRHVLRLDEIEADARIRRLAASQGDDERVGSGGATGSRSTSWFPVDRRRRVGRGTLTAPTNPPRQLVAEGG
jgi:hypothetical protein